MVKKGHRLTIVCSSFSHKLEKLPTVEGTHKREMLDGVQILWLKTPRYRSNVSRLFNYLVFYWRLHMLERLIDESVDFVVCSSPPPFWIWFCRRFARQRGASLVFELRDLWPDVIIEGSRLAWLNPAVWLMKLAEKVAYRDADHVVAVNQRVGPILEQRGMQADKFLDIPNGVIIDPDTDKTVLDDGIDAAIPRDGRFLVGYAGTLSKVYGLEYLLQAARELQGTGIHFVLAGGGGDETAIRQMAAELDNVSFVGWVPKQQLFAFLSSMDIAYAGLLDRSSFTAGSDSTKVFEYMKAKLPIVHALAGQQSVVEECGCGLHVPAEDAQVLIDAFNKLKSLSAQELHTYGLAGWDYLTSTRTYPVLAARWQTVLSK